MAPGLTLLGVGALPEARIPGDVFTLETWWRAESALAPNLESHLWWEPAPVRVTADQRLELPVGPLTGDVPYPSQEWPAGAIVRGQRSVQIPREASAGTLILSGQVVDDEGQPAGGIVVLGTVQVTPLERTFQMPSVVWPSGAVFGGRVRLVGVDVTSASARPGETVPVVVVWQAVEAMDRSYTAFVHLLGADGRVAAQEDHVPGRGARPTTSWLPGEVIVDRFDLALPADLPVGDYGLEIGLYDAGQPRLPRLPLGDGGDAVHLGRLSVTK
jgi:hypothetical protein